MHSGVPSFIMFWVCVLGSIFFLTKQCDLESYECEHAFGELHKNHEWDTKISSTPSPHGSGVPSFNSDPFALFSVVLCFGTFVVSIFISVVIYVGSVFLLCFSLQDCKIPRKPFPIGNH